MTAFHTEEFFHAKELIEKLDESEVFEIVQVCIDRFKVEGIIRAEALLTLVRRAGGYPGYTCPRCGKADCGGHYIDQQPSGEKENGSS